MTKTRFYIVNGITLYRLLASFVLFFLVLQGQVVIFRWMLAISFFTDALDGFLARKLKATSELGSRLDSIADDLTILVAIIAMFILKPEFSQQHLLMIILLAAVLIFQNVAAVIRYHRQSSFHTYLAKAATVLQATFFTLLFFLDEPSLVIFYLAYVVTMLDLLEEIALVFVLKEWKTDVKGLYWVLKTNGRVGRRK